MKIYFAWHDRNGRPDFRVWKPIPSIQKLWFGKLTYINFWKWSLIIDRRVDGFWGHIKETIWKCRLKDRLN